MALKTKLLLVFLFLSGYASGQSMLNPYVYDGGGHYLLRFAVQYRTTNHSYLTSAPFSDTGSFPAGSNVIRVETKATPTTNAVTTAIYMYADDPDNDRIAFKDGDLLSLRIMDRDWNILTSYVGSQASTFDPTTNEIYSFTGGGTNGCDVKDATTGAHKRYYNTTFGNVSGHIYYDYPNQKFYTFPSNAGIQVWGFSGSSIVLEQTLWMPTQDGGCYDYVMDKLVNIDNSNSQRFREQSREGFEGIYVWPTPVALNAEGLCVAPDGTFMFADPSGYHFGITGGNRFWWSDQRGVYLKYDRAPSMTRFVRFSGGSVVGKTDTQKIRAQVGEKIYSPVYDTDTFTNTENTSAWTFTFSQGGDADITWRTSATAPTTTPKTQYDSDLPTYEGWGSTTPSAESGTPGTDRYKQAVLTVKNATPIDVITIKELVDNIQPDILMVQHKETTMHVYKAVSPNQIGVMPNAGTPANYFTNATAAQRFTFDAGGFADDKDNNSYEQMVDPALINTDTQGQLTLVARRSNTAEEAVYLNVGTSGSNNNRFIFYHNRAANGNLIRMLRYDNAGAIATDIRTPADATTVFKRIDFINNGSSMAINVNGVAQSLSVTVGSNNGVWFGNMSVLANRVQQGTYNGAGSAFGDFRLTLYKGTPLTTQQNDLLDDYIDQESMR